MLNKDKRSLLLSMLLGDGCLTEIKRKNKRYGLLSVTHGLNQADYLAWKSQIAGFLLDKNVKTRSFNKGTAGQFQVCDKRLRSWRKFTYPNGKKSIDRILPFIKHPEFAIAIWLMDDGYVESSFSKLKNGEKKLYGARFRIFTCDQNFEQHENIIKWFQDNLNVTPKVHLMKKHNKTYPYLKFNQADSLLLWEKIREVVLKIKSMQYKFRYIEYIYQYKLSQCTPSKEDDIVRHS